MLGSGTWWSRPGGTSSTDDCNREDPEQVIRLTRTTYLYDGAGNIKAMGTDTFVYDAASRLVSATYRNEFGMLEDTAASRYDPFGNRVWGMTSARGARSLSTNPSTNRLTGMAESPVTYDSRGNVTAWDTIKYKYDALDVQIRSQDTEPTATFDDSYVYTADDERIITIAKGPPASETWILRDLDGLVLRKFFRSQGTTTWLKDTVHRDGQVLAVVYPGELQRHAHLDHLGTVRLWTEADKSVFEGKSYFPFGEPIFDDLDAEKLRFTGHERDRHRSPGCGLANENDTVNNQTLSSPETFAACDWITSENTTVTSTKEVRFRAGDYVGLGDDFEVRDTAVFSVEIEAALNNTFQDLDYMHARYCSPWWGRFLTVDPVDSAEPVLPQTWNKYSYAINNPLKFSDPDGQAANLVTGLGGALIGGLLGGAGSVIAQLTSDTPVSDLNFQDVGAAAAGGAVSGGLAGLTLGTSLVVQGGAGAAIAVTAGTNVVGGGVERALDSSEETQVLDASAAALDLGVGVVAGAGGVLVENAVKKPLPALQGQIDSMRAAARGGGRGSFSASRGAQTMEQRAESIRTTARVLSNVAGAKITGVGGAELKRRLEDDDKEPE